MGNLDRSRLAKELEPYIASQIRSALNAALGKAALPTLGGSGGVIGITPPAVLTSHVLATATGLGTYHSISGATAGHVLRASGATTALFAQLQHGDLGGVSANQHHNQSHAHNSADHTGLLAWATVDKTGSSLGHLETRNYAQLNSRTHDIVGGDHSYTGGAALDVFGLSAASTLARLTPSADVSAGASAILRSNAGALGLRNINVNGVLQSDSLNFALGVNVAPDGAAALDIRAGATSDHSQRIKQISGQTGRLWRIENTSGQELIVLDSVGNLQSGNPGFVSGLSGWQVTPTGNAEFNNGRFRGELHATVMVFDEVSVRNGTELITPAGGALELDVTLVATGTPAIRNVRTTAFGDQDYLDYRTDSVTGSGTGITARTIENILSVKNPDTGHYQVFRAGEVLRMKVWTGSAIEETWLRVNSALDMGTYYAYFVQIMSGTLPVSYTAGAAAAGYGKSGEGAIRLSADDPYGPLIDIFTTGAAPWAGDIYPHVRLGRLDGVGVPGLSGIRQYGLALGANLADATKPYMFASNLGVRQYNIDSAWNDGTNDTARIEAGGRARFGTNVDSPANTFLDINPALGLATFRGVAEFLAGSSGIANFSDANLDNIANGSTYARVNSTLISGGNIRVGVGTKDSTLNGFALDATEFVGQAGGVDQVVMGANGKIEAGFDGGVPAVTLDSEGIVVQATTVFSLNHDYAFRNNTGIYGGVRGAYNPTYGNQLAMVADTTGSRKPNVEMLANGSATYPGYARVYADAGGGSGLRAQIILQAGTYGSNTITLDADEITVIGELTAPGVLNFRSTAYGM